MIKKNINHPESYPPFHISNGILYKRGDVVHDIKRMAQDAANYHRRFGYRAIVIQVKKPKPEWHTLGRWIVYMRKP